MKLVSVITPDFWPGLKVLAHSLKHRGNMPDMEWLLLSETGVVPEGWAAWLGKQGFLAIGMPFTAVGQDRWPASLPELPGSNKRLDVCWNRLRLFLLPKDEYIWIDTDMLCVNDANVLLNTKHLSACPQFAYRPHPTSIATGWVRFDPDEALFNECMEVLNSTPDIVLPDQNILNKALRAHEYDGLVKLKPYWYDMVSGLAIKHPSWWKPEKAIFIHFAGPKKPWEPGLPNYVLPQHLSLWKQVTDIWRDYAKEENIHEVRTD